MSGWASGLQALVDAGAITGFVLITATGACQPAAGPFEAECASAEVSPALQQLIAPFYSGDSAPGCYELWGEPGPPPLLLRLGHGVLLGCAGVLLACAPRLAAVVPPPPAHPQARSCRSSTPAPAGRLQWDPAGDWAWGLCTCRAACCWCPTSAAPGPNRCAGAGWLRSTQGGTHSRAQAAPPADSVVPATPLQVVCAVEKVCASMMSSTEQQASVMLRAGC
jgi:hypothetical protein